MKRSLIIPLVVLGLILVAVAAAMAMRDDKGQIAAIATFEECAAAGYPVMESFPEQCRTPDGRTFVRAVATSTPETEGQTTYKDLVFVTSPESGDTIASPVTITGEARGNWYFEASFPVAIADSDGRVISQKYAEAQGEWMTTEYVPFVATITFDPGTETEGYIIFEKDNPSGMPENADSFRIPVKFASNPQPGTGSNPGGTQLTACRPTGCSGQICAEEDMASTCEFRAEYACYKESFARCERQADGTCGWTETAGLAACLANPPALE